MCDKVVREERVVVCDNVVTCVRACVAGWVCLKELYVTMLYVKELCVCVTMCEKCVCVCDKVACERVVVCD